MIPDSTTILIHIFCLVDEFCKSYACELPHKGAPYKLIDSEVITLVLFQALLGIESERSFLRFMTRFFPGWFQLVDQSQYNRRTKEVSLRLNQFRKYLIDKLDIQTDLFVIDSMPIPLINPVRVYQSGSFPEMSFGHKASLKTDYYGGKLHVLITAHGVPMLFDLTAANIDDREMLDELLADTGFITVVGDKGYLDQERQKTLKEKQRITLITPYRKNQKQKLPECLKTLYRKTRKRIESLFNQLTDHFHFKDFLAKTLQGLTTRILQKITALTMGIYLNTILGRKRLAIKSLLA